MKPHRPASRFIIAVILFLLPVCSRADVSLPHVFGDHMVIQRNLPVHVWGTARAGEQVSVAFRGETKSAKADDLGRWELYLSPAEAGGPFEMTVQGNNAVALRDILVGDVWVASGQSNMERQLYLANNAQAEIAAANYPKIRLLQVERQTADYPMTDLKAKPWTACTPESVADFSAVAYFFARDVQKKTGVPIGVISSSWGGTPAESWTSLRALSSDASLMPAFAARANIADNEATTRLMMQKEEAEFRDAAAKAAVEGKPAPVRPWHADFPSWGPAALYNAMIAPLTAFPIRGVIWYQGESNDKPDREPIYAKVFQTLIRDWRNAWKQADFPFLYVQIANWDAGPVNLWPEVREAQRQALSLANTAMVVTIDIGDTTDIHPKNKQDVGARLALAARAIAYGEKIEYSGPLYRQTTKEEGALRVWFDHLGGGLMIRNGPALKGFEIAGADHKFVAAEARIDGVTVVVSNPAVPSPMFVRYSWAANPDCSLYNREGLPASPFRSSE